MSFPILGAAAILAWGVAGTAWAILADLPKSFIALGTFFVELGLAFLFQATMEPGALRTSMVSALALSALASVGIFWKLMKVEQRGMK